MPDGLPIGYRRFTDGITRPVFREQDGRQFVIDGDGQRVHGVWLDPRWKQRQTDDNAGDPVPIIREARSG